MSTYAQPSGGPVTTMEPLLTTEQVATILNVAPSTVRRWAQNGDLPSVRVGFNAYTLRFRRTDIEALVSPPNWNGTPAANGSPAKNGESGADETNCTR